MAQRGRRRGRRKPAAEPSAWDKELATVSMVVRAKLRSKRGREPSDDDVRRLAMGILLCCAGDSDWFEVAEDFMRLDRQKREKDGELRSSSVVVDARGFDAARERNTRKKRRGW